MSVVQTIHYSGRDESLRRFLVFLAPSLSARFETHPAVDRFLESHTSNPPECLVVDADFAEADLDIICDRGLALPLIAAGDAESQTRDKWLDAGAVAFVSPDDSRLLRSAVTGSLSASREHERVECEMREFRKRLAKLSSKQRRVLDALIQGGSNKQIAADHGVSERTLERRRAELIAELDVRSVIEAAWWYGRSELPESGKARRWPVLDLKSIAADEGQGTPVPDDMLYAGTIEATN